MRRSAALLAILAGASAFADPPRFDLEVYYDVTPMTAAPGGVFAGTASVFAFAMGDAAVYDAGGVLHVFDDPDFWASSIQKMNVHGHAFGTGWSATSNDFLTWTPEQGFENHGKLPGKFHGNIEACNDLGHAVMWNVTDSNATHAFLWDGQTWSSIGTLREDPNAWAAVNPNDINNSGTIVGASTTDGVNDQGGLTTHAYKWHPDTGIIDLGSLGGELANSYATDINESGYIVGSSSVAPFTPELATLWTPEGEIISLTPDAFMSIAQVITENNTVFGQMYLDFNVSHAFVWTAADGLIDLESLDRLTFVGFSDANRDGVAVGLSIDNVYQLYATAYIPGEGLVNLNDAVSAEWGDLWLNEGIAVHDDGTIVTSAFGTNDDGQLGNRSVYLSPASACPADMNGDSKLNVLDFIAFQDAFVKSDPDADCDGDGQFTILDFVCFQGAFVAGCR